ncbi:MAG: hypothetical protein HRT90_05005 [Candidatus Margulisbacteria bacterium]|nr:hypothetical protein [Candidatus Margulisiibacteriota bacterium]
MVVKENQSGRNELFVDTINGAVMDRQDFVDLIESGNYSGYQISVVNNIATPMSKPDGTTINNLG